MAKTKATEKKTANGLSGLDCIPNLKQLTRIVVNDLCNGHRPLLWGSPGVGKSSFIYALARSVFKCRVETLIGSQCTPEDVNGFPVEAGRTKDARGNEFSLVSFAPRDMFVRLNRDGGILFLDELTTCMPSVQAPLLRLLNDGVAGEYQLDLQRVGTIAAANPPEQAANGSELTPPMANRVKHYRYPEGMEARKEWCELFPGYFGQPHEVNGMGKKLPEEFLIRSRSFVAGYLARRLNSWIQVPEDAFGQSGPWPSPRTWTRVAESIARALFDGGKPVDVLDEIAAAIGTPAALEFLTYLREHDIPDPEDLLSGKVRFATNGYIDLDMATLWSVTEAVKARFTDARALAAAAVFLQASQLKCIEASAAPYYELARVSAQKINTGECTPKTWQQFHIITAAYDKLSNHIKRG